MSVFNKFNCLGHDLLDNVHHFSTDTFKIVLSNVSPDPANTVLADIAEITPGNGYPQGGLTLTGVSVSRVGGSGVVIAANDPTFTASGSFGPFQFAVLYNASITGGKLMGWWDYGTPILMRYGGESFTVDLDQVNGMLQVQ